jgi:hypothetical protein
MCPVFAIVTGVLKTSIYTPLYLQYYLLHAAGLYYLYNCNANREAGSRNHLHLNLPHLLPVNARVMWYFCVKHSVAKIYA